MKARLLKKILNNTGYIVNNNEEYIAVGSPLCHDLFSVNKKTLCLKYALDRGGRSAMLNKGDKDGNNEMLFIWDKLQELIDNGQIHDIITGQDELENPLPVFTVKEGELIQTFTDKYGWPNTTINGDLMHDNDYFKTKEEAIAYGIKECEYWIKYSEERLIEDQEKIDKRKQRIADYKLLVEKLKAS